MVRAFRYDRSPPRRGTVVACFNGFVDLGRVTKSDTFAPVPLKPDPNWANQ